MALAEMGYRDPTSATDTVWQRAHHTEQSAFHWLAEHPDRLSIIMRYMSHQREGLPTWLDSFSFEAEHGQSTDANTVLFVDVGGGNGHQGAELRQRLSPSTQGRIIVQDLPQMILQAPELPGTEKMVHDFMTTQPVKGRYEKPQSPQLILKLVLKRLVQTDRADWYSRCPRILSAEHLAWYEFSLQIALRRSSSSPLTFARLA